MIDFNAAKFRTACGLLMLFLGIVFVAGCQTIKYESRFMQRISQKEGDAFKMSAAQLRVQLYDLAGIFAGTIEQAADQIIAETTDNDIHRHALLWKINAIPKAYRALFQADPAVGFIDTWVFSLQMIDYFENGPGRTDFGEWYHVALDAARKNETMVKSLAVKLRGEDVIDDINRFQEKIVAWAARNPIARDFTYRYTVVPELNQVIGEQEMDTFQTVGNLAISVDEMAEQLGSQMILMTKLARWEAELAMADTGNQAGIQSGLASLNELGTSVKQITPVIEGADKLIASEREKIIAAIRKERIAILADIERQRNETLAYVTRERTAVTDDLKSLRQVIEEIIAQERQMVLQAIDTQRVQTLLELEAVGNRIVARSLAQSKQVIDHFFLRLVQVLGGLLIIGVLLALILIRTRKT